MKTILFIHNYDEVAFGSVDSGGDVEGSIRYWLGKSPGMHIHEMNHIYVIEDQKDYIGEVEKYLDEQARYNRKLIDHAEREQYERLRKKFETA